MENKVGIEVGLKKCDSEPYNEEIEELFEVLLDALDEIDEEKEQAEKIKAEEEEKELQALLKEEGRSEEEIKEEILGLVDKIIE